MVIPRLSSAAKGINDFITHLINLRDAGKMKCHDKLAFALNLENDSPIDILPSPDMDVYPLMFIFAIFSASLPGYLVNKIQIWTL